MKRISDFIAEELAAAFVRPVHERTARIHAAEKRP